MYLCGASTFRPIVRELVPGERYRVVAINVCTVCAFSPDWMSALASECALELGSYAAHASGRVAGY